MDKAATWQRLLTLNAVKGEMLEGKWDISMTEVSRAGAYLRKADLARADLSGEDLTGADLSGANLRRANLCRVNLSRADLREANLSGANLIGANLISARLIRANLIEADFRRADLSKTKLIGANLSSANLERANLIGADLSGTDLSEADLSGADLNGAKLIGADLSGANLQGADLIGANFSDAALVSANLSGVDLSRADLTRANFSGVNLRSSNLEKSNLERTNFSAATLTDCRVYGISAWGVILDKGTEQSNLRVTPQNEPEITIDNLEVAQFVYLLLHNDKIRTIIDTIGTKGVLILGRFNPERKVVLDAIRNKLRQLGYLPMMFDFEKPNERDFTETIKILAGMSLFIIADITNPKSSPLELQAIVPNYMIPFVPIIQENEEPFSMFNDLKNKYSWMLDVLRYDSPGNLMNVIEEAIITPALLCAKQLAFKKTQTSSFRHTKDYQ